MSATQRLKTVVFYLLLSATAFLWGTASLVVAPLLPFRQRYQIIVQSWCRLAVWLARTLVGIRYEVHGLENIPSRPCVILAKHQSTWETFFLSGLFAPLSQVLKRELLMVPFFGWALALMRPIAIDRDNPKLALKQMAKQGHEHLMKGNWVLVFPEGTRVPVGESGKFSRGGSALAVNAGLPVLPIAHNAGQFWPKQGWAKYPGTIQVFIGPPMAAEGEGPRAISELNQRAERWIGERMAEIDRTPAASSASLAR